MSNPKEPRTEVAEGVTIISRHGIERELLRMRKSVGSLPEHLRGQIVEFFCDSKYGNHYVISVRNADSVNAIAAFLSPLRGSVTFVQGGEPICYVLRSG